MRSAQFIDKMTRFVDERKTDHGCRGRNKKTPAEAGVS
jgi:hypothetical protein